MNPAVGIRPIRTPDESDSDLTMKWEVIRPDYPLPLDVNIDSLIDGSTASAEDAGYLPSVVEFRKVEVSPGVWQWEQSKIIETAVIDDADAEWTETYLAKVGEGEGYYADPTKKKAEIGDDDVKITLGSKELVINENDSDDDGVLDIEDTDGVDDDPELYPVLLKMPQGDRGAVILSWPDSVQIWGDKNRTQKLLATPGSAGLLSPPTIVFIEAITGST